MTKCSVSIASIALVTAIVGCMHVRSAIAQDKAGLTTLEATRQYQELALEIEKRIAANAKPTTTLLAYQCIAYANLKSYLKLRECVEKLEMNIRQGDTAVESDNGWIDWGWDARPIPGLLTADASLELGQYQDAIEAAKRALAVIPNMNADSTSLWSPTRVRWTALSVLVAAAAAKGDKEQARRFTNEIEGTSVPFFGSAAASQEKSESLARAYMALGEYKKALGELNPGIGRLLTGIAGDRLNDRFDLPRLLMRAKALTELGEVAEAKRVWEQLLLAPRLKDIGDLHWIALFERGRIAEAEGDYARAVALLQDAVEVIERQRATINTEASKIGFIGDKQAAYARLISVLIKQGRATDAFDYVERSKSRALVDMLASKKDFSSRAIDAERARRLLAELDAADLASRVQSDAANQGDKAPGSRVLELTRNQMAQSAPDLAALVTVTSLPIDELKLLVANDEVLVEYYYQQKEMFVFLVDHQRLQVFALDATNLEGKVRELRSSLEHIGSDEWQATAEGLYERLWKPIEASTSGKNVTIIAHGALHYLPFSILRRPDGELLIDHVGLRFLPSASVLKFLHPASGGRQGKLLAFGNPDLGDMKLNLPFAEDEARKLAGLFPDSRLLTRKDASETAFRRVGGIFSRIHFATHGAFQPEKPLNSGLFLAKDEENDGILSVGELYSMSLDADLVTLSACETGLGRVANGDDVVGLTRGFLYAGSRSIVASLWSVDDRATSVLMENFYQNLQRLSKREALRRAQIATREQFRHPFFWAAFQLTGRAD